MVFITQSFRGGAKRRTRNPEATSARVSGFRVRAFGAPRNDELFYPLPNRQREHA